MNMSAAKIQKIDDEGRVFNTECHTKFIVVQHNKGVFCYVCPITVAVMKEYNIKRHYTTKYSSQFDKIVGQARVDKTKHLKNPFKKTR